jgi:hypothetical protein
VSIPPAKSPCVTLVLETIAPSITINGWLFPDSEVIPRIVMFDEEPGPVAPCVISTPASFPLKAFDMSGSPALVKDS